MLFFFFFSPYLKAWQFIVLAGWLSHSGIHSTLFVSLSWEVTAIINDSFFVWQLERYCTHLKSYESFKTEFQGDYDAAAVIAQCKSCGHKWKPTLAFIWAALPLPLGTATTWDSLQGGLYDVIQMLSKSRGRAVMKCCCPLAPIDVYLEHQAGLTGLGRNQHPSLFNDKWRIIRKLSAASLCLGLQ